MATTLGGVGGNTQTTASSVVGSTFLDGLASGLNTTDIINQLASIQSQAVTRLNTQKSTLSDKLTFYQTMNASLAAVQLAAQDLANPAQLVSNQVNISGYTDAAAPVAASATADAQQGSYQLVVDHLAAVHKIISGANQVADPTATLNFSGDVRINGKTVTVHEGDTLNNLRDAINTSGAGVTATVVQVGDTDHRLMLTAQNSGAANAMDLVDASSSGILQRLGFVTGTPTIKHSMDAGRSAQSDGVSNSALDVAIAFGLTIPPAGRVLIDGTAMTLNLQTDSLAAIRDQINNDAQLQGKGVTASVVTSHTDGGDAYSLKITKAEGTLSLQDDNNVLQTLGLVKQSVANEIQSAQDAQIHLDGISITRSTNSMDDVIDGVQIEVTKADPKSTLTLSVTPDLNSVVTKVQAFVNSYNSVVNRAASAQQFNTDTMQGGLAFGDAAIMGLEQGLRGAVTAPITVLGGTPGMLASVGITTDAHDNLVLDSSKLQSTLAQDPNAVAKLFGLSTTAGSNEIQVMNTTRQTADSGTAGYTVHINQAAQKATDTSREFTDGTLSTAETLTFDGTYQVALDAGMTLQQAADRLNGWLQTDTRPYVASVVGESGHQHLQLQHEQYGASYQVTVASSLDKGAGGTDLGGDTAGVQAAVAGQDVAGTINGETATGKGQYLIGDATNLRTAGLQLKITTALSNLDLGTVSIAKGAAKRLSDYIGFATDAQTGSMTDGSNSINSSINDIDAEILRTQAHVQTYSDDLRLKFQAMEVAISKSQVLQQYMTGQITAMTATGK